MRFCILFIAVVLLMSACSSTSAPTENKLPTQSFESSPTVKPNASASPARPNLQSEITDGRFKATASSLGNIDFKNYSYPLPHGWQNPDGSDLTLTNGKLDPVSVDTDLGMDPDE